MESSNSERVELPASFEDADMDYLAQLIADMMERLMRHNDRIPLLPESLTKFHSRTPANISVLEYLRRIIRYTNVEKSCLLLTLHYVDQICARNPLFFLTSLTVHRFVIAAITVSSKGLCDTFCTNSLYAKVGGIPPQELNWLERDFLAAIDWRLTCTREVLQEYYINLVQNHSSGQFVIIGPQSPTDTSSSSDIDMDSVQSRSSSPSDTPTRSTRHRHRPSPHETSTILIDTSVLLTSEAPVRPTLEQNMAFAALQQSWDTQPPVEEDPQRSSTP